MKYNNNFRLPFLLLSILFLYACVSTQVQKNKAGIETAMKKYDELILKLDVDSIPLLFTKNGNLGNIAIGRDSIQRFLSSFKNIKVISQSSFSTSIVINGNFATQKGNYLQTDLMNQKDTINVKGDYETQWLWVKKRGWLINKMTTKPTN